MRVRKRVLIICGLILLILYTARVIVVNKNADKDIHSSCNDNRIYNS